MTFTASDNVGVTGYCLKETAGSTDCTWSLTAPTSYAFNSEGSKTLYAWVKDAAGIVSNPSTATITISSAPSLPNLTLYQPPGWADKMIISTITGGNADSTVFSTDDTVYVDWAAENYGTVSISSTFYTAIYVDGVQKMYWSTDSLVSSTTSSAYIFVSDYSLGKLSAGTHEIKVKVDSTGAITESNESDNEYKKTINITAPLIIGICGSSSGGSFVIAPTTGLCSTGTASAVSGTSAWNWTCTGTGGGATDNCSASIKPDTTAPAITAYSLPATSSNLTVPVILSASDDAGVTGYCLKENAGSAGCSWNTSAPTYYTFSNAGSKILFAFVKDNAENVTSSAGATVVIAGVPASPTIQLPKTGQSLCYDTSGAAIQCNGSGQDGERQSGVPWPDLRFVDNGDGSILDKLTSLIWTKDGNLMQTRDPSFDADGTSGNGKVTWQHALDYVKKLNLENYLGHNDWRLPNINELASLVNVSAVKNTEWLAAQGFTNVLSDVYWSSTSEANPLDPGWGTNVAWCMVMDSGFVWDFSKSNSNFGGVQQIPLWPVRSSTDTLPLSPVLQTGQVSCWNASGTAISCSATGQDGDTQKGAVWSTPRFVLNNNGTVTDQLTGIVIAQDGNAPGPTVCNPGTIKTWQDALNYIACLNQNGYLGFSDWRMPNRTEMMSLINWQVPNSATYYNSIGFTNFQSNYWTSSTLASEYTSVWGVSPAMGWGEPIRAVLKTASAAVVPIRLGAQLAGQLLNVTRSGFGSGTVTSAPAGIDCGGTCSARYAKDTKLTLTVAAGTGSIFAGWSGACSGTGDCVVTFDSDKSVTASFNRVAPYISLSLAASNFGSVNTGTSSATQIFTITNNGATPLVIGTISIAGANAVNFTVTNDNCSGHSVAFGTNCMVSVAFVPVAGGQLTANLVIPNNDPDTPSFSVALSGKGEAPETISLPKSGQTTCYDKFGTVISCVGTWQDGEVQAGVAWPGVRFTNNNNGTIKDNLTGLIWAQDGGTSAFTTCAGGTKTWQGALDYVKCLNQNNYKGSSDWRLPNINEFDSLINIGVTDPGQWLIDKGFTSIKDDYWTSSTFINFRDYAYMVSTRNFIEVGEIYKSKAELHYVLPVRGASDGTAKVARTGQKLCHDTMGNQIDCAGTGQDGELQAGTIWPSPRFIDNMDGTVTDNLTGLMWLQDPKCFGSIVWQNAIDNIKSFNSGQSTMHCAEYSSQYKNWRLPNLKELHSVSDRSEFNPSLPSGHPFIGMAGFDQTMWTGDTVVGGDTSVTNKAWSIGMSHGPHYVKYKELQLSARDAMYGWPVRDGVRIFPLSNDLGIISAGKASPDKSITVSNNGYVDLVIGSVTLKGVNPADFTKTSDSCSGKKLQRLETCNVTVSFSPAAAGAKSALLEVPSSEPTTPILNVNLSGTALVPDNTPPKTEVNPKTGGTYNAQFSLQLSCDDGTGWGCDKTYYTTDNSTPTVVSSVYAAKILIDKNTTLKFFSVDKSGNAEAVKTEIYVIDTIKPVVSIASPLGGSSLLSLKKITGTASDAETAVSKVEIQIKEGANYLTAAGTFTNIENWIPATGTISWSLATENVVWKPATSYTITARATDTAGNTSDEFIAVAFQEPAFTTLSIDLSTQNMLQNGQLKVSGKLTRLPDKGGDLSGLTITLSIIKPDAKEIRPQPTTITTDASGHFIFDNIAQLGFALKGAYNIKAYFDGTSTLEQSDSDAKTLLVGEKAGYAIIIQGKIATDLEGQKSHAKTANRIYNALKSRGFGDDAIQYFSYQSAAEAVAAKVLVTAAPTVAVIQDAITNWALNKMKGVAAPLFIIMVDHGTSGNFIINNETITPAALDGWLSTLETGLVGTDAANTKRIIINGSCFSGSFIPTLSKTGRIIITSAAATEESYKGPSEPDGVRSGEFFLDALFRSLKNGMSIKLAFEEATDQTRIYTRKGGSANGTGLGVDGAVQHPLLDDDGSKSGSNNLSSLDGDGVIASNIYLGVGNTITNAAGASEITDITPTTLLAADKTSTQLWLQTFGSHAAVSSAWAEVRTPDMVLAPGGTSSSQLDLTLEKQLMIPKAGTVNQWELNTPYSGFTAPGKYEIYYYSRDAISSEISPMKRSIVYKQKTGNMPPEKVQKLVAPENGAKLKTMSAFEWTAATDPEKAALTYTLEIATDEAFTNIVHKEEEIAGTATYVADGILKDLTNYYWRIIAVDQYGEKSTSTVSSFSTDNTNGLPGLITGYVRSDGTGSAIPTATVKIGDGIASQVMPNGAYLLQSGTGATTVTIQSAGYKTKILNVTITAGKVLNSSVYLSPDTPASVNGICGANDKVNLISAPTTGFCTSGNATPVVTGSNSWSWTCEGTNGGSTANCAASKTKAGDCDGSGTVTIAEVQSAINMFLGLKTVEACVDLDSSNSVSIAEVQKVINSFLGL